MSEWSGFFDAHRVGESWDRTYLAEDFAKFFAPLVGNGVFAGRSNELQVFQASPANLSVIVSSGQSWIEGYGYYNNSDLTLPVHPADGALGRIDRVVNRWSASDRQIRTVCKKGTPAVNPVAPPLQWDANCKELNLATIEVSAGLSAITQDKIKDTRADSSVCGWVTGLIDQLDTATLFAQWDAAYEKAFAETEDYLEAQKAAWEAFFENVANDLSIPVPSLEDAGKILRVSPNSDQYELDSPDTSLLQEGGIAEAAAVGRAIKKVSNPRNLLDNSDFRNPVNQRGFSEAYDDCFCIDRWEMNVSSGQGDISAVRLLDDCLQLNVGKGELDFEQTIPNHDSLVGKQCTVAVNLGGTVYCGAFSFGQQSAPLYFGDTKLKFYSVASRSAIFRITSDVDVRYNLYWVAIYEGEYTINTLPEYQPKGYGAELAECMRYYYRNWDGTMSQQTIASLYAPREERTTSVTLPVPMRRIPEIIVYNPITKNSGCVADWVTDADVPAEVIYVTKHQFTIGGNMTAGQMVAYNYEAIAEFL